LIGFAGFGQIGLRLDLVDSLCLRRSGTIAIVGESVINCVYDWKNGKRSQAERPIAIHLNIWAFGTKKATLIMRIIRTKQIPRGI
jgi:hypothetical protein